MGDVWVDDDRTRYRLSTHKARTEIQRAGTEMESSTSTVPGTPPVGSHPVASLDDSKLKEAMNALEKFHNDNQFSPRTNYNKLRSAREKATFTLMMKLAPDLLTSIRKEFFAREDSLQLNDFLYIIQLHLLKDMPETEKVEFMSYMYELYKEVDVNGDGDMEWEELTTFIVQKANQLNKGNKLSSIATYYDSSEILSDACKKRQRNEYSHMVMIPTMNSFAAIEEHKNDIYIYQAVSGKLITEMKTYSPALCICDIPEKNMIATACADMTILVSSTIDPVPARQFQPLHVWPTVGSQMSLAWMPSNELLYSGSENGDIQAWRVSDQSCQETLKSHTDMVLSLLALNVTNNLVSASMDAHIAVWDTYTHQELLKLKGHRKGIFGLSYNPDFRLLVSCGFDHDAMVWSPFVKSLVYKLKGHHASLIGCQCIENSPEIITADIEGVFKIWDIRNFQCVQSFSPAEAADRATKKAPIHLNCFFQTTLPSRNSQQKELDARVYCASKKIMCFDQTRIVHEPTTDLTGVFWLAWNEESSVFLTASEKNLIVWDGLLGSVTQRHTNICGEEITACCLDDRLRKIVIGDVSGRINVYNPANGTLMKTCVDDVHETVVDLQYIKSSRRFVAGYANGLMRIYDEGALDDCPLVRSFEEFNRHPELFGLRYSEDDRTVASIGGASEFMRLWDIGSGKCDMEITACEPSESIVTLEYLDPTDDPENPNPYNIIATSDSRGNIVFWGGRNSRYAGRRVSGFLNHTTYLSVLEKRKRPQNPDEREPPRRAFPSENGSEEYAEALSYDPSNISMAENSGTSATGDAQSDFETYHRTVLAMAKLEMEASEKTWGRIAPAVTLAYDPDSKSFYTGNDMGILRKFSLEDLMNSLDQIESMAQDDDMEELTHHQLFMKAALDLGERDYSAALFPVYELPVQYIFTDTPEIVPKIPNLGVKFCWHVAAHEERILAIKFTKHGVLTSSADCMVKMWSDQGEPIGELLQNIPVGVRNHAWKMELDVVDIMRKEDEELAGILKEVDELAKDEDLPDITKMDFSGLEPGAESAEFSRSQLRQRIEKTSQILGISFPIEDRRSVGKLISDLDDASTVSGMSSTIASSVKEVKAKSTGRKGISDALNETKSQERSQKVEKKKVYTDMQQKMQMMKMYNIADKFEEKAGTKLPSIKQKIAKMHNQDDASSVGSQVYAADDASYTSLLSNVDDQSTKAKSEQSESLVSIDVTSKVLKEAERLTKKFNAAKALERLTLPTPAKMKNTEFLKSKCNKFQSFSALDAALNRDTKTIMNEHDKYALKSKYKSRGDESK